MSNLKKGDLVMTPKGLGFVHEQQLESVFVRLLDGKNVAFHISQTIKATSPQAEAYLNEKGWVLQDGNYVQLGNMYIIPPPLNGDYGFALKFTAYKPYFENAPAMQVEAILMAKLLNATKD